MLLLFLSLSIDITSAPSPVEVIGPFIAWGFPNSVVGEVVGYDVKLTSATGSVVIVEKNKTDVYHLLEREDVAVNLGLTTSITIQVIYPRTLSRSSFNPCSSL